MVGVSLRFALERVPEVTAALVALGVPVETHEKWTRPTPDVTVRSRDPLTVGLEVEHGGHTATVVADEALEVQSVTVDGDPVSSLRD